jgi:hypothetical protein
MILKALKFTILIATLLFSLPSISNDSNCSGIKNNKRRLACYDDPYKSEEYFKICNNFEKLSNKLKDRLDISISKNDYESIFADVYNSYKNCHGNTSVKKEKMVQYERNVVAFFITRDLWSEGIKACEKLNINGCKWSLLSDKKPIDEIKTRYPLFNDMLLQSDRNGNYPDVGMQIQQVLTQVVRF